MPPVNNNNPRHTVFDRSFDTASQNTSDCGSQDTVSRNRRPSVPFVNERREFDPRYDPRRPETFHLYHQPRREEEEIVFQKKDDDDDDDDSDEIPTNAHFASARHYQRLASTSNNQSQPNITYLNERQRATSGRTVAYYNAQRNDISFVQPSTGRVVNRNLPGPYSNNPFFHPDVDARLDRPFDESSREISAVSELDSLDEVMQQDSFTTASEKTGDDELQATQLSAIEEHPSLEAAGSMAYSLTQLNNPSMLPSLKSSESSSEDNVPGRYPMDQTNNPREQPAEADPFPPVEADPFPSDPWTSDPFAVQEQLLNTTNQYLGTNRMHSSPKLPVTPKPIPDHYFQQFGVRSSSTPGSTRSSLITTPEPASSDHFRQHVTTSAKSSSTTPGSTRSRRILITPDPTFVSARSELTPGSSSADFGASSRASTVQTTPETPTGSLACSDTARREAEKIMQGFNSRGRHGEQRTCSKGSRITQHTNDTTTDYNISSKGSDPSTTAEDTQTYNSEDHDLALHDLCGESSSTDDVAWRNALHVLSAQPQLASVLDSSGWTPLHVACLGSAPPPVYMTRSLLYVNPAAARKVDGGGRLPLHLVTASSGDIETMQLLIQEYPQAVYQTDSQGWTPLHLMLKNFGVDITLEHCRVLLGAGTMTPDGTEANRTPRVLLRRKAHLSLSVEELDRLLPQAAPTTRLAQDDIHEEAFRGYPNDVQASLRRLCQWKKKQRRINGHIRSGKEEDLELENAFNIDPDSTNPAAQFTPVNKQLPIHIIVRRGLAESRNRRTHEDEETNGVSDVSEDDSDDDREELIDTSFAPRFLELLRLFVAFYPDGLIARDFQGHTPLLTALLTSSTLPSLEVVELLLGKRTTGYQTLPSWARNMPLHSFNSGRYINPAMVSCRVRQQLPLHIVAEEMTGNFPILATVQDCYPGAIELRDARGRTPLHILLRNYPRDPLNPSAVALLLSDTVAQTFDDEFKLPFDLLVDSAGSLPQEPPIIKNPDGTFSNHTNTYNKFFQGVIIASSKGNRRNRLEPYAFLWRLRALPPWLRRQACTAKFVQDFLVEELASPTKCALILLYAALLCTLIAVFRVQVQYFISDPDTTIPSWSAFAVLLSAFGILVFQLTFWSLCMSMSEFLHLCIFNVWRWVDLASIILVTATTSMINYSSISDEVILRTATAATGLLWCSAIGFFSSWWYGAAVFTASAQKMASLAFWPLVVVSILFIGFAQMFNTIAHINCGEVLSEGGDLCNVRDSYMMLYFLVIGEPVVADFDEQSRLANGIGSLAVLFLVAISIIVLSVIFMVVLSGSQWDVEDLALTCFWEPKLTFIIFSCQPDSTCYTKTKSTATLETLWNITTQIVSGRNGIKGTYWYARFAGKSALTKLCYWLIAALVLPLWLLVGLMTFGLLWPPQVRRFLFRPSLTPSSQNLRGKASLAEHYGAQMSSMRQELGQVRDMSFERSNEVQREVRELKEILILATSE